MRWFASLVVLCLLAGSGAPPRAEVRAPYGPQRLASADAVAPLVSSRRGGAVTPDVRLAVFTVTPVALTIVAPAQTVLPASRGPIAQPLAGAPRSYSARGPPDGPLAGGITRS